MIKINNVMKEGKVTILCFCMILMVTSVSFGQNTVYSTIAKNINSEANSLQHNLNKAGDTLHLSSDFNLYKVEFIGTYESKVFEVERGKKKTSIPLASVPVGEYTIAAFQIEKSDDIYQYQKTIVFRISRLLPIEDTILEEELIAEVTPEPEVIEEKPVIKEEEPIIKKEEALVAEVAKKEPIVKEKKEKPVKVKKEKVKKAKVKKEVAPKAKTRVATSTPKPKKEYIKPEKIVKEEKVVKTKPARDTRVTETKKPSLDSTVYKSYNLTNGRGGRYVVQSRAEYRAQNLRPNGEPYN
ncbi:hypothetical protein KO494_08840 [Lacinutrix sp. C3R15]|uniref:hypothetical protein n=1 Tax=Flavobacteriaceae TaxID=49546 RepID=UPI001C083304|nr:MULTISPECIES: hypothetical protein [Flavobacteriaceae]MBU2939642.1 hypothetical protein [Lacinutrix sp. C3R15]MDO6622957.1 hypothetical protein [Oceanihabitans sp. 1_MG-2023]